MLCVAISKYEDIVRFCCLNVLKSCQPDELVSTFKQQLIPKILINYSIIKH